MKTGKMRDLDGIASVHDTHRDFDGVLAHYSALLIAARIRGGRVLEAGCSTGVMTPYLLDVAAQLEVVEGSEVYAKSVAGKYAGKLRMHVGLFEEFAPDDPFDDVVAANVLHHMSDPLAAIKRFSSWLRPGGVLHVTVPNIASFHRQLGVAMGLVPSVEAPSPRNEFFQQPGRFTRESLEMLMGGAGLTGVETEGFFFKPFPHDLMNRINLSREVLDGLFAMGRKYPHLACHLYASGKNPA